jgi:hypothetical protein
LIAAVNSKESEQILQQENRFVKISTIVLLSFLISVGGVTLVSGQHFQSDSAATTPCALCTNMGLLGNSNYNMFPYKAASSSYPTAKFSTSIAITQSLNASGYFTGELEGCTADDSFTYQNNIFDNPSGEAIQEVLAVGLTPTTPSCWNIEWDPAGETQVYVYQAEMIPAAYTPSFESAGNTLNFIVSGTSGKLPNGEINITSFSLTLNGNTIATIAPSQMICGALNPNPPCTVGDPVGNTLGPIYYTNATAQNMNIVGPGEGQTVLFTSGAGTITYCGTMPQNPPQLGGPASGGTSTVESSNLFYGNVTSVSTSCSNAPKAYSQWFNYVPTTPNPGVKGGSPKGVTITSPKAGFTVSSKSLTVTGTDTLIAGNYATGVAGAALGFPCSNGNTANPPGCPQEPQLNLLQAYAGNYNPQKGTFQVRMEVSSLANLAAVSPPAQGQYWSVQWTFKGVEYFGMMSEWLTDVTATSPPNNVTGPFRASGISFWYGTVSVQETPGDELFYSNYNFIGPAAGSYSAAANGWITITIPASGVGKPTTGSVFTGLESITGQVFGPSVLQGTNYNGLEIISNPDAIYAVMPYLLGQTRLPDGYVQVTILPKGESPSTSTAWQTAVLVSYPSSKWEATFNLSGLKAGNYVIYAREFSYYTNTAGQISQVSFTYS